jgi:asparagine synthase (glutamine-hydrolysing)
MCGIAGCLWCQDERISEATLESMARALAHRGPDGHGAYLANTSGGWKVGLAHRRLAIIDLTGGAQPMIAADGSVVIFNGEIYNYRDLKLELERRGAVFRTNCDTEVLLLGYREWGDDLVRRLVGMFAFALWDPDAERLVVVRDRFGKKPLFLYRRDGVFAFASEIKALLALPGVEAALDHESLGLYFGFRYVPGPRTMFRGIEKLGPGQMLIWEDGRETTATYYVPPDARPRVVDPTVSRPLEDFGRLLDQAVARRLIADVPLGAFLSGGLDSSIIVALMSRHMGKRVSTYSIGFAESKYSELRYADLVAERLKCDHHPLLFSTRELIDGLIPATRFRDAPVSEPADIPILLLSREAAQSLKVVLTGEGADELLGGYPKHAYDGLAALYQRVVPKNLHDVLVEPILRSLPYGFRRLKTAAASAGRHEFVDRMIRWFGALSPEEQKALTTVPRPRFTLTNDDSHNSLLRRILFFDQTVWLPDNLLERGDRMTMAASLEARMPFMDHELAAFASSLPDSYRVRVLTGKWMLRRVAERLLPRAIVNRPKSGFRMPVNEWLRDEMRPFLTDALNGRSVGRPFYRPGRVEAILDEHLKGRQNHEKLLWQMLALELFLREYRPTL